MVGLPAEEGSAETVDVLLTNALIEERARDGLFGFTIRGVANGFTGNDRLETFIELATAEEIENLNCDLPLTGVGADQLVADLHARWPALQEVEALLSN